VGASFRFFASNAALRKAPLHGSSPGSKACNQNEELGSLFYPVSSFTYSTPQIMVRMFRLPSM
jgi:hypothetical protein